MQKLINNKKSNTDKMTSHIATTADFAEDSLTTWCTHDSSLDFSVSPLSVENATDNTSQTVDHPTETLPAMKRAGKKTIKGIKKVGKCTAKGLKKGYKGAIMIGATAGVVVVYTVGYVLAAPYYVVGAILDTMPTNTDWSSTGRRYL